MFRYFYRKWNELVCVRKNVIVGSGFVVGTGSFITAPDRMVVGKNVVIGRNCWIAVNGKIGDGVLISSYVGIVGRSDHDMRAIGYQMSSAPWLYSSDARKRTSVDFVDIGDDVWIGFGAIIVSGVKIGKGAVIAAGALIVNDVADYQIVASSPSKVIGTRFSEREQREHEAKINCTRYE